MTSLLLHYRTKTCPDEEQKRAMASTSVPKEARLQGKASPGPPCPERGYKCGPPRWHAWPTRSLHRSTSAARQAAARACVSSSRRPGTCRWQGCELPKKACRAHVRADACMYSASGNAPTGAQRRPGRRYTPNLTASELKPGSQRTGLPWRFSTDAPYWMYQRLSLIHI